MNPTLRAIIIIATMGSVRISSAGDAMGSAPNQAKLTVVPFGTGGTFKMLYDRRQRPQSVYGNGTVYVVYNGGVLPEPKGKGKSAKGNPTFIRYDLATGVFSDPVVLGPGSKDHHFSPIIWQDAQNRLHVLHGCHKTPGHHLIAKTPADSIAATEDWLAAAEINSSISYPSVYTIAAERQVIYFRNGEHRGAWRYLVSSDQGKTWRGPEAPVIDLNMGGETLDVPAKEMDETSSYQSCVPSKDGKSLHVAFCQYDDNKKNLLEKFYNPRYGTKKNLGLKYNLYYVKIDLEANTVRNVAGKLVKTPISLVTANATCKIWDTEWRGTGVPPDILLDHKDQPSFLHVLTEDTPEALNYYYVTHRDGKWTQTVIRSSSHEWNSGHLSRDKAGVLHAYLLVGETYLKGGYNDKHGGGTIEEWVSRDDGKTWSKRRDLTPDPNTYRGWRFNNVRPVRRRDATVVDGLWLFYGWQDAEASTARSFLLMDKTLWKPSNIP